VSDQGSAFIDAAPMVNASRFRARHQEDWERLEALLKRIERRSIRALSEDDLLALPLLYRTALSSLSVARDTSLERGLISYLEQLSTRAYFHIYGVQTPIGRQILHFFTRGWPDAVRGLWRETLFCVVLTACAAVLAFFLVRNDPSWFFGIMPQGLADGRDPTASAATLRATLYDRHDDWLGTFAVALFTHNAQIAIFSFALGFALAAPTFLLIAYNGLMLGAFFSVFASKGLGWNAAGWLMIHGTTELFAICIAGAAGMRIGMAVAFPGRRSRIDAVSQAGRSAALAMAGTVIMLAVAGLLEGVGRQTVLVDASRYAIGSAALVAWCLYFYLPRRA
jgi:uncharacterized membrane protein SpoIIM required for sporulation